MDELAELFRDAVLDHITDIAIDKGLGPPEYYEVYVDSSKDNQVNLSIFGNISEYGIINPLHKYIDKIGVNQWNQNIVNQINKMIINLPKYNNLLYSINTDKTPISLKMYIIYEK